jgi:hypothetical protein
LERPETINAQNKTAQMNIRIFLSSGRTGVKVLSMRFNILRSARLSKGILGWLALISLAGTAWAGITWEQTKESLGCRLNGDLLWQFNFSTNQGKPFFHPLCLAGSEPLTALKPTDHHWHYGLWFSWKYIHGVNYWEEDKTGHAEGATRWDAPTITTRKDGSAQIKMKLRYMSKTNNAVIMQEERLITVSAPAEQGAVTIDWTSRFQAGAEELLLDRTHMPGEEHGAVNGGYAGFSLRVAQPPAPCQFVTAEQPVEKFESDRARPDSKAAACNLTQGGKTNGVAIFSHVSNTGGDSPWYMINSKAMRWFSPALLAPAARKVKPHERFTWRFRAQTRAGGWTSEMLREASADYNE